MKSAVLALLMLVSPSFAVAEPMRNANTYPVNMRGGPGVGFAVLDQLDPGEVAERGRCDLRGLWCLMSTDQKVGWINTSILRATQAEVVPGTDQAAPADSLTVGPVPINPVFVEPLPEAPTAEPRASVGSGITRSQPEPDNETPGQIAPVRPLPDDTDTVRTLPDDTDTVRTLPDAANPVLSAPDSVEPVWPRRDVAGLIVPGADIPLIFATDAPFYNVTDGYVNLRAGPGTDNEIIGQLQPGEGGYLDICAPGQSWCRVETPGVGLAWVKMTLMGTRGF
jgi:uncharacterized protein YraI